MEVTAGELVWRSGECADCSEPTSLTPQPSIPCLAPLDAIPTAIFRPCASAVIVKSHSLKRLSASNGAAFASSGVVWSGMTWNARPCTMRLGATWYGRRALRCVVVLRIRLARSTVMGHLWLLSQIIKSYDAVDVACSAPLDEIWPQLDFGQTWARLTKSCQLLSENVPKWPILNQSLPNLAAGEQACLE